MSVYSTRWTMKITDLSITGRANVMLYIAMLTVMRKIDDMKTSTWKCLSTDDLKGEIWKDIDGYEGSYQISNYGRVKSVERRSKKSNGLLMLVKERICKQYSCRGYMYVCLSKDGEQHKKKVHRLVASSFIPNPNNHPDVNHKDEILSNNNVSNLEWCTKEYNRHYGTGLLRMKQTLRKKYGVPIIRYTINGNETKRYECGIDIIQDGFDRRAVYRCCKDNNRTHKGYKWKFA